MSEYYAVQRSGSTDHLAHYGIKGMKWGVRKAVARGNQKKLDRHFRKAAKKLAKLQDIGLNSNKSYAKAAAYGTAAAGIGALAIGGTSGIRRKIRANNIKSYNELGEHLNKLTIHAYSDPMSKETDWLTFMKNRDDINKQIRSKKNIIRKLNSYDEWLNKSSGIPNPFGKTTPIGTMQNANGSLTYKFGKERLTNKQVLRAGAGIAALGLGAKAAQHLYRAKNDAEYRERADQFKNAMDEAFAGTKYAGKYVAEPKQRKRKRRYNYG